MYRAIPKIVVFAAIVAVVLAIYWRLQTPQSDPGIIYVNPNIGSGNP